MEFVVVGIVFALLGGFLVYLKNKEKEKIGIISATETSTVRQLEEQRRAIADEIGGGSFRERVELKGRIECESPLTADMTKQKCVYFRNVVERDYEEDYWETDKDGHRHRRTRRGSDTVSELVQSTPFHLRDATGRIRVEPDGAEIDLVQVKDSFQPASSVNMSSGRISWGGFNFQMSSSWSMGEGRRTLGYHFREYLCPLDRNVYLLGEVSDEGGELVIRRPTKEGRFFISYKSEEQILAEAGRNIAFYHWASIAMFALGAAVAILGPLLSK